MKRIAFRVLLYRTRHKNTAQTPLFEFHLKQKGFGNPIGSHALDAWKGIQHLNEGVQMGQPSEEKLAGTQRTSLQPTSLWNILGAAPYINQAIARK
jgi:hypothetical protein